MMDPAWPLALCVLLAAPVDAATTGDPLEYEAAASRAGHDAGAHIRLAIWSEAHGLRDEAAAQLGVAVKLDEGNPTARGLLGQVSYGGNWQRPEAVARAVRSDEALSSLLAEYDARRVATPWTPDDQWALALWCESRGLPDEARAHLAAVTRLDPGRVAAWQRLGYRQHGGRWMSPEEIRAAQAEEAARLDADRRWKPRLMTWKKRGPTEAELSSVTDPRAVRAIWEVFWLDAPRQPVVALRLLRQIADPSATEALAAIAIRDVPDVLRVPAIEALRQRDAHEYMDFLLDQMHDPIRYEVLKNRHNHAAGLVIHEPSRDVRRIYRPRFVIASMNITSSDPRRIMLGYERSLARARRDAEGRVADRVYADVERIAQENDWNASINRRVALVLSEATGQDLDPERSAWAGWWNESAKYGPLPSEPPPNRYRPVVRSRVGSASRSTSRPAAWSRGRPSGRSAGSDPSSH